MSQQPDMRHRRQAFFPESDAAWLCVRVADEVWGPRTHIRREQYGRNFFALVLSGSATLSCNGEQRQVRAGQVWSMLSGHSYQVRVNETMHIKLIVGGGTACDRDSAALADALPAVWEPLRPHSIESVITELLDVAEEGGAAVEAVGRHSLQLLISLLRHAPQRQSSSGAQATFIACRDYINRQALELSTVSDAAIECGIDRAYLSRLFKQYAGESAALFLSRCKMQHAAGELASGSSVADTAAACGYKSADVFARAFQRHYGMTPRRWRQQLD